MATPLTVPRSEQAPASGGGLGLFWKFTAVLLLAAGAAAAVFFSGVTIDSLKAKMRALASSQASHQMPADPVPPPRPSDQWDGLVRVNAEDEAAIGFQFAEVKAQNVPIRLELTGRTAYDPNTINKVRPRFDTRVEEVYALSGQKVKKGDRLVELYSTDLAAAKSDFQTKWVQWQHDLNLYGLRKKLVETGAISQQLWVDTKNDEQKSRLDFELSKDKLAVFYEVPKEEIDPLLDHLGDKVSDQKDYGKLSQKARMTLRAKTDGYVITRDVVPSNYYESTDTLMEIAPLDHLWVWVNVYELDQAMVGVGQTMEIQFPFLEQRIKGKVDYVASEVSKDTRAVKVRATIPNPGARLKSEMLVKAMLDIPPVPGQTVVPRLAVVADNGFEYVFVRVPGKEKATGVSSAERIVDRFKRVHIVIAQENTDNVVVASGLTPGQEVATNGSLILSQLYDDQKVMTTGQPASAQ